MRRLTTKEFEDKSNEVHNNFYSYEKVVYMNNKIKVIITCPKHGDFEQTPYHHLQGSGCPKCSIEKQTLPQKEFEDKSNEVHNNFYSYEKVIYTNNHTRVIITCPKHGDFEQRPYHHLQGSGCPKCGVERQTLTQKEFEEKANKIHNNWYSYKKVVYINAHIKVIITCPKHGDFEQIPNKHLIGQGCPQCAIGGFKTSKPAILYILEFHNGLYKIGITNANVKKRYSLEDRAKIKAYKEYFYYSGRKAYQHEAQVKELCKPYQYQGEPILKTGNTEIFHTNVHRIYKEKVIKNDN